MARLRSSIPFNDARLKSDTALVKYDQIALSYEHSVEMLHLQRTGENYSFLSNCWDRHIPKKYRRRKPSTTC